MGRKESNKKKKTVLVWTSNNTSYSLTLVLLNDLIYHMTSRLGVMGCKESNQKTKKQNCIGFNLK